MSFATRFSVLCLILACCLNSAPARCADWVVMERKSGNNPLGATLTAGQVTRAGTARVKPSDNKVWNAHGRVTPSIQTDDVGAFTGKLLGQALSNLCVRAESKLSGRLKDTASALHLVRAAATTVRRKPRLVASAISTAYEAAETAGATAAASGLPEGVAANAAAAFDACEQALKSAFEFASGLRRNPSSDEIDRLKRKIEDSREALQEAFHIILEFEGIEDLCDG